MDYAVAHFVARPYITARGPYSNEYFIARLFATVAASVGARLVRMGKELLAAAGPGDLRPGDPPRQSSFGTSLNLQAAYGGLRGYWRNTLTKNGAYTIRFSKLISG